MLVGMTDTLSAEGLSMAFPLRSSVCVTLAFLLPAPVGWQEVGKRQEGSQGETCGAGGMERSWIVEFSRIDMNPGSIF